MNRSRSRWKRRVARALRCLGVQVRRGAGGLVLLAALPVTLATPRDVTLELRYPLPEAGEVVLTWGIDDWQPVAESRWPPRTRLDGMMHTIMEREGEVFVSRLRLPAGSVLDFGFMITRLGNGEPCERVWDGDWWHRVEDADSVLVHRPLVVAQREALTPAPPGAPLIEQEIRYRLPEASEVELAWGLNRWKAPPDRMRPPGSALVDGIVRTKMERSGDVFSTAVRVPEGTVVDFYFEITEVRNGVRCKVSDNRWYGQFEERGGAYRVVARPDAPLEIVAGPSVIDRLFPWTFRVDPAGWSLIAAVTLVTFSIVALAWRGVRRWKPCRSLRDGLQREAAEHRLPAAAAAAIAWAPFAIVLLFSTFLIVGFLQSPFRDAIHAENFMWAEGNRFIFKENSWVELLTFGVLLLAGVLGLGLAFRLARRQRARFDAGFFAAFSIGSLVVALEEVSWGQWLLGFEPPLVIQKLNSQKELTLHNLDGFQGHSEYLEVAFAAFGLVGVLLAALGIARRVAPPMLLLPWFATVAVLAGLDLANDYVAIERYLDWGVRQLTEVAEMMIGITALLYVWLGARRLRLPRRPADARAA